MLIHKDYIKTTFFYGLADDCILSFLTTLRKKILNTNMCLLSTIEPIEDEYQDF